MHFDYYQIHYYCFYVYFGRCDRLIHISPKCSLTDLESPLELKRTTCPADPDETPSRPPLPSDMVDSLVLQFTPAKESLRPKFDLTDAELSLARQYAATENDDEQRQMVEASDFLMDYINEQPVYHPNYEDS